MQTVAVSKAETTAQHYVNCWFYASYLTKSNHHTHNITNAQQLDSTMSGPAPLHHSSATAAELTGFTLV